MDISYSQIIYAFLLASFAGFSTIIGAAIVFLSKRKNLEMLSIGLGFSAGVMIYISFMEILPEALNDFKSIYNGILGDLIGIFCFFIGIILSALVDKLIPENLSKQKNEEEIKELPLNQEALDFCSQYYSDVFQKTCAVYEEQKQLKNKALHKTGIFVAIAIALHNFPEGFATFMSGLENLSFGIMIAIAVAIHNIPEGMAVSLPIYHATNDKKKAFIYSALSGLTEPLGALVCAFLLLPFLSPLVLAVCFAIIAGIMVYIAFDELLPAARIYGEAHHCLYGLLAGMALMAVSLILLSHLGV
ncbi:zinc transporter ZupT [Campylobacter sp. MIT 99-7217]|uniref:zinc transporter ZupT n=1 Tax=Campylobacter sp. MIT 99-7217 TaxID=535091 RepID=UPI00115ACD6A|nr:zinc transporter ZupT [Campylobacter sp. MIT 99-7217]TQR30355.1 zinc transporter ZupT [Campylobacter sp. MIT 99-7217]